MTHQWREYDPFHRACERCGLRVFMRHSDGRVRGWQSMNWRGQPGPLMLQAREGDAWGTCSPPPKPPIPEPVIIEYTGDPDQHPGCERVMHVAGGLGSSAGLVSVAALAPACGVEPTWWELGPARAWHGWTWCAECFPTHKPHHVRRAAAGWFQQNAVPLKQAIAIGEARAVREARKRHPEAAAALDAAKKRAAVKVEPRACPLCGRQLVSGHVTWGGHVRRVTEPGELRGLVLLVCGGCVGRQKPPRKG